MRQPTAEIVWADHRRQKSELGRNVAGSGGLSGRMTHSSFAVFQVSPILPHGPRRAKTTVKLGPEVIGPVILRRRRLLAGGQSKILFVQSMDNVASQYEHRSTTRRHQFLGQSTP
jgi:hypothetical protein